MNNCSWRATTKSSGKEYKTKCSVLLRCATSFFSNSGRNESKPKTVTTRGPAHHRIQVLQYPYITHLLPRKHAAAPPCEFTSYNATIFGETVITFKTYTFTRRDACGEALRTTDFSDYHTLSLQPHHPLHLKPKVPTEVSPYISYVTLTAISGKARMSYIARCSCST